MSEELYSGGLPTGWVSEDDGSIVFSPGAYKAPVFKSEPEEEPKPLSFDDRLRRYYGEENVDTYDFTRPFRRGVEKGFKQTVGDLASFGEILTFSDYLEDTADAWGKDAASIPTRGFSSAFVGEDSWDLADWGGWVSEEVGKVGCQLAPFVIAALIPEPTTTGAGVAGTLGTIGRFGSKILGLGGKGFKGKAARTIGLGMTATMQGSEFSETREITGVENRPLALASGAVQGALNYLPISRILNSKGGTGKRFYTDILYSLLGTAGQEAVTELAQEAVSLGTNKAAALLADKTYDLATPENFFRLVDATAAGFVGGGAMGGLGAYGNYLGDRNPTPDEDAEFLNEVASALTPEERQSIQSQSQLAVYKGLIDSTRKAVNDSERYFSQQEVDIVGEFLEKADNLQQEDSVKSKIKEELSPIVVAMRSRVEAKPEETKELTELEKTAAELRQAAESNAGVNIEQQQVDAEIQSDLNVERQRAVNTATYDNPMPQSLAPYKTENSDLDYTAAVGARYLHETEEGVVLAEITNVDPRSGNVIQAIWNGEVVLNEEGPNFTIDQIRDATDKEVGAVRSPRSTVEDVNQTLQDVRANAEIRRNAQKENEDILRQMRESSSIETPGVTDPKELQLLAGAPKIPASLARNIPEAYRGSAAQQTQRFQEQKSSKKRRTKRRSYFQQTPKETPKETAKQETAETTTTPKKKAGRPSSLKPVAGRTAPAKPRAKTDKPRAKTEVSIKEEIANLKQQKDANQSKQNESLERIKDSAAQVFKPDLSSTNSFLFVAPINFNALSDLIIEVGQQIKYSIRDAYLSLKIKKLQAGSKKNPTNTEILADYLDLLQGPTDIMVSLKSEKVQIDPSQITLVRDAVIKYFEEARKRKSFQKKQIIDKNGNVSQWVDSILEEIIDYKTETVLGDPDFLGNREATLVKVPFKVKESFIDWIGENIIQVPRGATFHKLGRSAIVVNSDKAKNLTVSGVDGTKDSVEYFMPIEGPESNPTASNLYNENGQATDSYIGFSETKGKRSITIKSINLANTPSTVYKLKDKLAKDLKSDPYVKDKKTTAFVYVPYDLIWDSNGEFRSENWNKVGKKSEWKFQSEMPQSVLDRHVLREKLSYIFDSIGSDGLAAEFKRDTSEGHAALSGYVNFARNHEEMDISKSFKPRNISKANKKEQIARLTPMEFADAIRDAIRAASDRAIQDWNRARDMADEIITAESDMVKGLDLYRRYRNDDLATKPFENIVVNGLDLSGNDLPPSIERQGVKYNLSRKFDRFLYYVSILKTKRESVNRTIKELGDNNLDTAKEKQLREKYDIYIKDAEASIQKVYSGTLGKHPNGDYLSLKEWRDKYDEEQSQSEKRTLGKIKTVGVIPLQLTPDKESEMAELQRFLNMEIGDTDYSSLEARAFAITRGLYSVPVTSYALPFKKELGAILQDSDLADKIMSDGDPNTLVYETIPEDNPDVVTIESTEITDYSSDVVTDREMEEVKRQDNARVRKLKGRNANAARRYRASFTSESMDDVHTANAEAVVAHDEVNIEVFDGDALDSLPTIAKKTSEKSVARLLDVLVKNNLMKANINKDGTKDFFDSFGKPLNGAKEFSDLILRLSINPLDNKSEVVQKVEAVEKEIKEAVKEEKKRIRESYGLIKIDEEGKVVTIKEDEYVPTKSFLATRKEAEGVAAQELNTFKEDLESNYRENISIEDQLEYKNWSKEHDVYQEISAIVSMAFGRGSKVLKNFMNRAFAWEFEEMAETDLYKQTVGRHEKDLPAEAFQKFQAKQQKNHSTPWEAFLTYFRDIISGAVSRQQMRTNYLKHELRSFTKGKNFKSKFDNRRLFTTLMKIAIEYNEGTIIDRWRENGERDLSKLHFKVKRNESSNEYSAVDLFARYKAILENPDDVSSLLFSKEWEGDSRYGNESNKQLVLDAYNRNASEILRDIELQKPKRPSIKAPKKPKTRGLTEKQIEQAQAAYDKERTSYDNAMRSYQSAEYNWRWRKEANSPNRLLRKRMLSELFEDTSNLLIKQSGMNAKLFRDLLGIKSQRSAKSTAVQVAHDIDTLIEDTKGAYGDRATKSVRAAGDVKKSPFGKRLRTVTDKEVEVYAEGLESMGTFEYIPEIFETITARKAVPQDYLSEKRIMFKGGKVGATGKLFGKPTEETAANDKYNVLAKAKGPQEIRSLLEEYSSVLPEEMVRRGMEILDNVPGKYLSDLNFEIAEDIVAGGVRLSGKFHEINGRLTSAINLETRNKEGADSDIAHELTHSLFGFLGDRELGHIKSMRTAAIEKLSRGAGTKYQKIVADILIEAGGSMDTVEWSRGVRRKVLPEGVSFPENFNEAVNSVYPLINDAEYFVYMMTEEGKIKELSSLPYISKSRFEAIVNKVKEIFKYIKEFITGDLKESIVRKFNNGEFSSRRRSLPAKTFGKYEYQQEVERSLVAGYREGANPEAAELIAAEAGAASTLLSDLVENSLANLANSEKYAGMILDEEGNVNPSARIQVMTQLKRNKGIAQYLKDFSSITGHTTLSPRTYLDMSAAQSTDKKMPESMWQVVSRTVALNFEFFISGYQRLQAKMETLNEGKDKLSELWEETKQLHYDKEYLATVSKDAKERAWELLRQADAKGRQSEAARLLEGFGFSIMQLNDQINDVTLGKNLSNIVEDMYAELYSTERGRRVLFSGRGWRGILNEYKKIKTGEAELEAALDPSVEGFRPPPKKVKLESPDDILKEYEKLGKKREKVDVNITPLHKLAAWQIRLKHDIDKKQLKIADDIDSYSRDMIDKSSSPSNLDQYISSEKRSKLEKKLKKAVKDGDRDLIEKLTRDIELESPVYSSYEKWFEEMQSKGGRAALTTLLNTIRSTSKKEADLARIYISKKSELKRFVKTFMETELSLSVLDDVVNSREFKDARKTAVEAVQLKPNEKIEYTQDSLILPSPDGEVVNISMDVGDKASLERQLGFLDEHLKKLNAYIIESNERISKGEENLDDVFNFFWVEQRDMIKALYNSNTTRAGGVSERSKILNVGKLGYKFKPMSNFLLDLGGYPARVSTQELQNHVDISERSEDWRKGFEQGNAKRLYDAAESHGHAADVLGVEQWWLDVGQEYFALMNEKGRELEVGDSLWVGGVEHKITKEDKAAVEYQSKGITELYDLNLKVLRGDIAASREVEEEVRGKRPSKGKDKPRKVSFTRKPIKTSETVLPKTFVMSSVAFAERVNQYYEQIIEPIRLINEQNANGDIADDVARAMKLSIYKEAKVLGKESLYDLIGSEWRYVEAFLGHREGKITNGTNPYFENPSIYSDARDLVGRGSITNLEELGAYFSSRSVDLSKSEEDVEIDMSLTQEEATYEILREMVSQIRRVHLKVSPNMSKAQSQDLKIIVLKERNSFNTARQEPIANWYFYDYGIHNTPQLAKIVADSSAQYIERFISSLEGVKGYLRGAKSKLDKKIEGFTADQARAAGNGDNFIKYDTLHMDISKLEALSNEIESIQLRDQKYEQALAQGVAQTAYNDLTAAAMASIKTGFRNLLGTPQRTRKRIQAIFGFSPRLHVSGIWNHVAAILETGGAASYGLGAGLVSAAKLGFKGDGKGARIKPAIKAFLKKSMDEAWAKELVLGQFKINENLAHIASRGYGIRIDAAGRFDNYFRNLETRGRIEREEELASRRETAKGRAYKRLVEAYNALAWIGIETGGNIGPRIFDMTGNNISFRGANTIARELDARLKKMHDLYKDRLWKWYNSPDKSFDPDKGDVISPSHLWGEKFFGLAKQNESSMKFLEDLFAQSGLDFHREALMFLQQLDSDKNAQFLDADKTAKIGIALFSENANTIASRPLEVRSSVAASNMWRLMGWSVAAYHNSVSWYSRSIKGDTRWWSVHGLRFQQLLAVMGSLTLVGAGYSIATDEIIEEFAKMFYGEVAANKQPYEEEELSRQVGGWIQYAFAAFPMFNIPINAFGGFVSGTAPRAASGIEFFWQSLVKKIIGYGVGVAQTKDPFYKFDYYVKSTFGNPAIRSAMNLISPVSSGRVDYANNQRLIRKFIDTDYSKQKGFGSGGFGSATPVSPHIDAMVSYAIANKREKLLKEFSLAVGKAEEMKKENPVDYVMRLYWGRDPWSTETKGTITFSMKAKVEQKIAEYGPEWLDAFRRTEENFNKGYRMLGGRPNRIKLDARSVVIAEGRPKRSRSTARAKSVFERARGRRRSEGDSSGYRRALSRTRRAYGV